MSGMSGIVGVNQMPMQSPVKVSEGSPMEEAKESPAEKAREQQQAAVQATATIAASSPGIGETVNVIA